MTRQKRDPAIGQPTSVVNVPSSIRQLLYAAAVYIDHKQMVASTFAATPSSKSSNEPTTRYFGLLVFAKVKPKTKDAKCFRQMSGDVWGLSNLTEPATNIESVDGTELRLNCHQQMLGDQQRSQR